MCLVSFSQQPQYSALKKFDSGVSPSWAYLVITDECSHKCPWCYGGFDGDLSGRMSLPDYEVVLKKLHEIGIRQVSIAGGEPTEHPDFRAFVSSAARWGFIVHIVTHGEHFGEDLVAFLEAEGVEQVQVNWQGSKRHDRVHGVPGSFSATRSALALLSHTTIETTVTITVGRYNIDEIADIMKEAADLGVTRLRVWETTGVGSAFLRGMEAASLFGRCQEAAAALGYRHTLSYDPSFQGDVSIPCLQFSDVYMYVDSQCRLMFCGAVPDRPEIANMLDPSLSGRQIRDEYLRFNAAALGESAPYCVARDGWLRGSEPRSVVAVVPPRRRDG